MRINAPDASTEVEPKKMSVLAALQGIGASALETIGNLMKTKVPKHLQEQGLSQELFEELSSGFYARMKEARDASLQHIAEESERPFLEAFTVDGIAQCMDRQQRCMEELLAEFGLSDNKSIVAFLKDHLTPLPEGVSWNMSRG